MRGCNKMFDFRHSDCRNYENIDVKKGICLIDNGIVSFDYTSCERFKIKPKCKYCKNFGDVSSEGIGRCTGLEDKEYWALGERIAITCNGFVDNIKE